MATTLNGSISHKPFEQLTVTPVAFSLTDGTGIPAPPQTPIKEPPTPGGGPLTSHPTTPDKIPGAYPSSDDGNDSDSPQQKQIDPTSQSSPTMDGQTSPQILRKPSGVRRLFSMSNLRSSFSSSRTSLALNRPSTDRPSTSFDRPFTPSMSSTASSSPVQPKQPLRTKRSGGNWFKRKSSLFMMSQDGTMNAVDEDQALDTRGTKRLKPAYSLPLLPEISELGGGEFGSGDLGWDSSAFKRM